MSEDKVNHPPHYKSDTGLECIDVWEALGIAEDACRATVIKYLWRCDKKENEIEDLKKARWYLDKLIELLNERD